MDPFELLKTDHRKVAQLFDELEAARGATKLSVFRQIRDELELHAQIEETIFYPALEKPEETHDLTLEAYEEHKVLKTLLAELDGAASADDEWQAKAKVLRENVEHHVDEEEKELFDKADDALSDEELENLGNRMAAEKKRQGKPVDMANADDDKPGIVTRIANFVGLGTKKSGSKTASSKKRPTSARSSKGSAKASKTSKKTATKKASAANARNSSKRGSKKAAASKTSKKSTPKKASKKSSKSVTTTKGGRGGAKKSAKKSARRR